MPLSFIHAADFHLGADLRRFDEAREWMEKAQFNALEKTVNLAADKTAAFILICGDLFDRRNPPSNVRQKAGDILSSAAHTPVYILPGTHDFLSEKSVYAENRADWAPDNVIILNDSIESPVRVPGVGCWLYFRPNMTNKSTISPIDGLERLRQEGYHIGLAHGSLQTGGLDFSQDFPVNPSEVKKSHLDYLALGHWHKSRAEVFGSTTVAYAGIAQPVSWSDPEKGSVLIVDIDDRGTIDARPVRVSSVSLKEVKATIYHPLEVKRLLEKMADFDTIVKLSLEYSDNFKEKREVEKIIAELSSRFLMVKSDSQNKGELQKSIAIPDKINEHFIEAFRAELAHLESADSPERKALYKKATDLGIAIIAGEE